jgi:hypothetical protein
MMCSSEKEISDLDVVDEVGLVCERQTKVLPCRHTSAQDAVY